MGYMTYTDIRGLHDIHRYTRYDLVSQDDQHTPTHVCMYTYIFIHTDIMYKHIQTHTHITCGKFLELSLSLSLSYTV